MALETTTNQRCADERQAFLLKLSDALRSLADPIEIQEVAAQILGEHLGVTRAIYAEVDGDEYVVARDHARSAPSVAGRHSIASLGLRRFADYCAGKTRVMNDSRNDPANDPADCTNYTAFAGAGIGVPLVKDGTLVAVLVVHINVPRTWTAAEIALVEETAERTWAAVERARAEEALRRSEQKLRLATQVAGMYSWELEIATDEIRFSGDVKDILGFAYTEPEDVFSRIRRYLVPEDSTRHSEALQRTMRGEGDLHSVTRAVNPDSGELVWMETHATLVRAGDGTPLRVVGIARNITERKRAEMVQKESEERFRALAEASPLGVGVSVEGKLIYINRAFELILGYQPGGLRGQPSSVLYYHPADREAWLALMKRGGQVSDHEVRFRRQDGTPVWVAINARPIELDGKPALIGLIQDVTERKQAEEEREQLQQEIKADLEAMTRLQRLGALFVKENDLGPILSEIVDAAMAISGADFGNMQILDEATSTLRIVAQRGFPQWWLDYWTSVSHVQGSCGTALERGERVIVEDVARSPVFVGTPGLEIQLRAGVRAVQSTPLFSRAGRPLGMFSIHYKTPRRPDGRALRLLDLLARQAADIIERAQAEASLKAANARLTEADRAKNEFLGVLSHELRNPLAPINNSLYVLDHAATGSAQAERAKEVIRRQVKQLSNLVNDLLDVTRVVRNKVQLQKAPLELNEVVRQAVEDNRSLFEQAGIHLELAPAPRPVLLIADHTRVTQVIGNLLQNAVKFTGQGGHTRVSVAVEGTEAVVCVGDDGIGMSRETLDRLFQPFSQAAQTLDRSQGGLGLGLALVKGLVELHGGTVSARSEGLGHGTEMIVRLPLDTGATLEDSSARPSMVRTRRRVLIIEDNVDSADSLKEALALGEHEIAVAYNGPEGLAKARELRPDVVLCDIGLPGMDGYDVARAFRTDEALKRTVLVALSGYALPENIQRAVEAGFQRHLSKPVAIAVLEDLLAKLPEEPGVVASGDCGT